MELEFDAGGTANVTFGMYIYTRNKPSIPLREFPFRKIKAEGRVLDEITDTGSPEMPISSYSWQVMRAPDICSDCVEHGVGGIDLVMSQGPAVPLTAVKEESKWFERLGTYHDPENNLLYIGKDEYRTLKKHGQIKKVVDAEDIRLLGFHKGDPMFLSYLELFFRYTGDPRHDNSAALYLISDTLRFTKHLITQHEGIARDDNNAWYRKDFKVLEKRNQVFWRAQRAIRKERRGNLVAVQ